MHREVPAYGRLQEAVAAGEGMAVVRVLDLGTGTGETLAAVLTRLAGLPVELTEPLPPGPFDLVVSALAVHHLEGPDNAALFDVVIDAVTP